VQRLLSKGDVSSLEAAQGVNMCIAAIQAQRAHDEPLADRAESPPATCTDAERRVQDVQHTQIVAEAQRPQSKGLEVAADQLWSRLIALRRSVDSTKAELAAVLASVRGAQQSALGGHLMHYSNLLLQVISMCSVCCADIRSS
jgi:hypothetical protein